MKKRWMSYEKIILTVPSYVECHTVEEARELFSDGQGMLDLDHPMDEEQLGFIEGSAVQEVK